MYRLLADLVLIAHLAFIAFVVAGALLAWRRPSIAGLHLPALAWGAYAVITGTVCPLTPLENALRAAGGGAVYEGSFVERYLLPLIYPAFVQGEAGRGWQVALGVVLLVGNAGAYALLVRRLRLAWRENHASSNEA